MDLNELQKEKIKQARASLSVETREAIDSIEWNSIVIGMRETKKFSFSQIETLGFQTELLLCGLLTPQEYPKELKSKMGLSEEAVNVLVKEMNELIFKKIKEKLIQKIGENRTAPETKVLKTEEISNEDNFVMQNAGITLEKVKEIEIPENKIGNKEEMLNQIENPSLIKEEKKEIPEIVKKVATPILAQKLTGSFQVPTVMTDHSPKLPPKVAIEAVAKPSIPKVDPYRMSPDE